MQGLGGKSRLSISIIPHIPLPPQFPNSTFPATLAG